jgi:phage FluMu protein Com
VFPSYRTSGLGEFSWASGLQTDVLNMLDMKLAKTAEKEGNYADAMRVYQFYYMDDEVQRLNELIAKDKIELIAKFKQSQSWINLVCPRCGALNKIGPEMREETIRSCFSCGMEYTDGILVFMMKKAMGLIPSTAQLPVPPRDEDKPQPRL